MAVTLLLVVSGLKDNMVHYIWQMWTAKKCLIMKDQKHQLQLLSTTAKPSNKTEDTLSQ